MQVTDGTSCGFAPPTRALRGPRTARRLPDAQRLTTMSALAADAARRFVAADPYPWPYDGDLRPENTALVVIDMQTDFCGVGGYVDKMGYDLSLTRAPIEPIKALLAAMRARGYHDHPHARGPPARPRRPAGQQALALARRHRRAASATPGPCGRILVRGEPGWEIIPELAPLPGESIIDKPGKGSFCATDLELILRTRGIAQPRPHRHHHRRLRAHDDARGQRPRLRMPAAVGLHRRHRPRQPPRGARRWSRCRAACSARMRRRGAVLEALAT